MMSRAETVADAAIAVVGEGGVRALTHRAVDARAGLPSGSTSNCFRTRDALLRGVVGRLVDRERVAWDELDSGRPPATAEELAELLGSFARKAVGPNRTLTVARYAILVETAVRPEWQSAVAAGARRVNAWGAEWLRLLGPTDPGHVLPLIGAQVDGMVLHQLSNPDPDFEPTARLRILLGRLLPHDELST